MSGNEIDPNNLNKWSDAAKEALTSSGCGWDASQSQFQDVQCLNKQVNSNADNPKTPTISPGLVDIVIPTSSGRLLEMLSAWREFLQGFHFLFLHFGDPSLPPQIPSWVDFEIYNKVDIQNAIGKQNAWILSIDDDLIRVFGFLLSKKRYIWFLEQGSLPALDSQGYRINALMIHFRNLITPSLPHVFHTGEDPHHPRKLTDYVRGYPYSLRDGVSTVISHGLWQNAPDYDAATHLVMSGQGQPTKLHEATQTIPKGSLSSLSFSNIALDREKMGPIMWQGSLPSIKTETRYAQTREKSPSLPISRFDDIFAGWVAKAVSDHLGFGIKSGMPYVLRRENDPIRNLVKESNGLLWWQEELVRFFHHEVEFTPQATTPQQCYLELASQMRKAFSNHPRSDIYFRVAKAMNLWTELWSRSERGKLVFHPSRSSSPRKDLAKTVNWLERSFFPDNRPINYQISPSWEFLETMEFWAPKPHERVVNPVDVEIGHRWKTYVYPLPRRFHKLAFLKYHTGKCLWSPCTMEEIGQHLQQYTDHQAENLILRKFMASLDFVFDPNEADVFLAPMMGVTVCFNMTGHANSGCRNGCLCQGRLFDKLIRKLSKMNNGKLHLILATQDSSENHHILQFLMKKPNVFVIDLGPKDGFVVPSLDSLIDRQPSHWKGGLPLEKRDIFVLANFGVRYEDRTAVYHQLKAYNGSKTVSVQEPNRAASYGWVPGFDPLSPTRSVFVMCLSGEKAFQKRIYDAWASVAIPVVVVRECENGGKTHFRSCGGLPEFPAPYYPAYIHKTYPSIGINYQEILVELTPEIVADGKVMQFLESIPETKIMRMLQRIEQLRTNFIYDYNGTGPDAFTSLLRNIEQHLKK